MHRVSEGQQHTQLVHHSLGENVGWTSCLAAE